MITKLALLAAISLMSAAMAMEETADAFNKSSYKSLLLNINRKINVHELQAVQSLDYAAICAQFSQPLVCQPLNLAAIFVQTITFPSIDLSKIYKKITEDDIVTHLGTTVDVNGVIGESVIILQPTTKFSVLSLGVYLPETAQQESIAAN